jgi:protein-S-isoprenylcysteine O-methyltransferase Ste14
MSNNMPVSQSEKMTGIDEAVAKRMRQVIGQFVFIVAVLVITSGRPTWLWLWVYIFASLAILLLNSRVMSRELIAERGQPGENVKPWDRKLASLSGLFALAALPVAGLDKRFGWSPPLGTWVHLVGLDCVVLGNLLFTWAMASNPFFSTAVRMQWDRHHTVAMGGPYRYVRHPGYVGYVVMSVGTALIFGSLWALAPVLVMTILLLARTALEDKALREELEGYEEYAQRVRYRLLPGIW